VRYAFVDKHRQQFTVRAMCRCLRIRPSGFYAWLKNPLSKLAREDVRQTDLLSKTWKESGRGYGDRKLHDDLHDQGETSCANRIARLARLAGIKAQIGYKRRPGSYGGKPSVVVDNTLARQFDVDAPDNLEHSMRRRGNCHDNAVAESFFTFLNAREYGAGHTGHARSQGRMCRLHRDALRKPTVKAVLR
jgi:transposase InsO family protein